ncbi:phosphoglycerate mutase-like protein [Camillea tinctor]|nr:phosphoglycerate mutase-like protein [Camillea tinctor]
MYLLLIRHGESVDNVAGLYAGSRDSPLTNHGVLQAKRLGAYLAEQRASIGPIKLVFASNLKRAVRTAEAVAEAQQAVLQVVQLPGLREKDFGSSEGTKYGARDYAGKLKPVVVQSDAESRDSMHIRINQFLDAHLDPVMKTYASDEVAVAIVSHGIILNVLFGALGKRYSVKAVPFALKAGSGAQPSQGVTWSNTGVMRIKVEPKKVTISSPQTIRSIAATSSNVGSTALADSHPAAVQLTIKDTNNVDHLQGLKKTRGGIGSAGSDSRQRTIDSFFGSATKKRKREEPEARR